MSTVNLTISSGPETLAGTLTTVDQTEPGPAVLLLSGSGPLDRDSNMKRLAIGVMEQLAGHLAGEGLASFRYDKRGVGASSGDYKSTGFYGNVADATAVVDLLRTRPDLDPDRIFIVGHSEGALIATELAVADERLAGVVLLAGTATSGEDVLRWQAERVNDTLPRPAKLLLRVLRQDLARTQRKRLAQIKATTGATSRILFVKINARWLREFMAHDPAPSLEALRIPVLALTGSKDIQVNPDDVERICRLVPSDCTGRVIDDLTHLLRTESGPPSVRNYKEQAKRPVDADLLAETTAWIRERAALVAPATQGSSPTTDSRTTNQENAMNSSRDHALMITDSGITITNYYWPGHRRHIPFSSIVAIEEIPLGIFTGRFRVVGLGFRRPRNFFPWDTRRGSMTRALVLDLGRRIRPVISPEDHDRVRKLIEDRLDDDPAEPTR